MSKRRSPTMDAAVQHRQSLATGFRDVDRSGDATACNRCLDLIAGIPFFHEIKQESFRIIADADPDRVLDAGCGAGTDLVALATSLPVNCQIMGLDASESLLARAAERTAVVRDRCSLVKGDIKNIPFRDRVFDSCRIDRVLQHLHEPETGVRELIRILKPGGTLIAFDNDWDTFSISLDDQDLAARLARFWRDSFASGRIGRELHRIFTECGIVDIHAVPRTLVLTNFSIAEQVFDIPVLLNRTEQAEVITQEEMITIWDELCSRVEEGTFSSGYTGFLVWGKKPWK